MNDLQNFNNFTMLKFFNLEEKNIQNFNVYFEDGVLYIDVTLHQKDEVCPHCGYTQYTVKDYVQKKLIHSTFTNQKCIINYRTRRYKCSHCAKTFYENNPFAFSGMKLTMNTVYNVLSDLRKVTETFFGVALRYHLSTTFVISIFDKYVDISRGVLPEVLCIDEVYAFKSKKSNYVCVLLDFKTQEIIDLLPSRRK
ncbi:MAG: transposase, partial [Erysipelothrix sp.]|nr:transposase [Erysipelothrix sp.]